MKTLETKKGITKAKGNGKSKEGAEEGAEGGAERAIFNESRLNG